MKHKTKRMWRSVVSAVLALTLVLGMATTAFATPEYVDRDTMEAKIVELYDMIEEYCAEDADAQAALDTVKDAVASEEFAAAIEELEAFLAEHDSSIDEVIDEIVVQINALNEYLYVLAEENPDAVASIEAKIAELEAILDEAVEQQDKLIAAGEDALEAIEEIVAIAAGESDGDMADAVNALQDAIKAADAAMDTVALDADAIDAVLNEAVEVAEEIKAEVEALIAEIEAAEDEIAAEVKAVIAEIEATLDAIDAAIIEFNAAVEGTIAEIQAIVEEIIAEIEAAIEEAIAYVEARIEAATTCDYEADADSQYLAIGDEAAADYAKILSETLNSEYGVKDGGFIEAEADEILAAIADNEEAIKVSDLITLGLGNAEIIEYVLSEDRTIDWEKYIGTEYAAYVDEAIAYVKAELSKNGVEDADIDMIVDIVESYAYGYTTLLCTYPEAVNDIKAINPEAKVIIVGMHNPLAGVVVNVDGTEVAVGEYVDYIIAASNAHYFGYALLTGNAIYVDAPDVAIGLDADEAYELMELLFELIDTSVLYPTEEGDAYIAEQILNAMNITKAEVGLWGDANSDGVVDSTDAMLICQYDAWMIDESGLNLSVCDVNGDDIVDSTDAMLVCQYDAWMIEKFPVEE